MMAINYMTVFWNLASSRETISLLNVYKGVPISYPATIINVGENAIQIITEKYQLVCLYHERETYIQLPGISDLIKAKVLGLDAPTSTAILSEFEVVTKSIGERREVRVCPKLAIEGNVQSQELADTYQGELADISQGGLGIFMEERDFFPKVYKSGRKLVLSFKLPGTYQLYQQKGYGYSSPQSSSSSRFDRDSLRYSPIHQPRITSEVSKIQRLVSPEIVVQGVVANSLAMERQRRHRIGVRILPNEVSRMVISQFISQRQSEIIQEINSVYQLISQG